MNQERIITEMGEYMPVKRTVIEPKVVRHKIWENGVARDILDNGETLVYSERNTLVTYTKEGVKKDERPLTKAEIQKLHDEVEKAFERFLY